MALTSFCTGLPCKIKDNILSVDGYAMSFQTRKSYLAGTDYYLSLSQEAATLHAGSAGVAVKDIMPQGFSWVLLSVNMKIHRYLQWPEKWQCRTYILPSGDLFSKRIVSCTDGSGKPVFEVCALWAVVKLSDKFSLVSSKPFCDRIGYYDGKCEVSGEERLKRFDIDDADRTLKRVAVRTDTDINGHVNNIALYRWMLDAAASDDSFDEHKIESCRIYYSKEIKFGLEIEVRVKKKQYDGRDCFLVAASDRAYAELIIGK